MLAGSKSSHRVQCARYSKVCGRTIDFHSPRHLIHGAVLKPAMRVAQKRIDFANLKVGRIGIKGRPLSGSCITATPNVTNGTNGPVKSKATVPDMQVGQKSDGVDGSCSNRRRDAPYWRCPYLLVGEATQCELPQSAWIWPRTFSKFMGPPKTTRPPSIAL